MIIAKSQRIEVRQLRTALVNGEEDDPTSSATAARAVSGGGAPLPAQAHLTGPPAGGYMGGWPRGPPPY